MGRGTFANLAAVTQDPSPLAALALRQAPSPSSQQAWPWWPLLPLYPYGRRGTQIRELVANQVWSFEQLHGVWYVAVPIRMTVLRVGDGLLLYAPLPATGEVLVALHQLEERYGEVHTIVLPTSSGLEHKIPAAALLRAFPRATLWVSDRQWSFPLNLPSSWLGFAADRTRILFRDGLPHPEQLSWIPLGPINLGLGTFHEVACLDQASGTLCVTDALVCFSPDPPSIFDLDPTPLLFHARERGSEPLTDTPIQRRKGWKRILLFANYFRPPSVTIPPIAELLADASAAQHRSPANHFGLFPFRWSKDWEREADELLCRSAGDCPFVLAPVLERLVFVRSREAFLAWLRALAERPDIQRLVTAHYQAPASVSASSFHCLAEQIEQLPWAQSDGAWSLLASIDSTLIQWKIIPQQESEDG